MTRDEFWATVHGAEVLEPESEAAAVPSRGVRGQVQRALNGIVFFLVYGALTGVMTLLYLALRPFYAAGDYARKMHDRKSDDKE